VQSSFRERLLEHAFVFAVLEEAWTRRRVVDVLRPEVDAGIDIVLECEGAIRHVQLKTTRRGSKVARQLVSTALSTKPAGCVVWLDFDEDEEGHLHLAYRFLGGPVGQPLALEGLRIAKHSRGDAQGVKHERPAVRVVPAGRFERVADVRALFDLLFDWKEGGLSARGENLPKQA
jgi:hypothetical protein